MYVSNLKDWIEFQMWCGLKYRTLKNQLKKAYIKRFSGQTIVLGIYKAGFPPVKVTTRVLYNRKWTDSLPLCITFGSDIIVNLTDRSIVKCRYSRVEFAQCEHLFVNSSNISFIDAGPIKMKSFTRDFQHVIRQQPSTETIKEWNQLYEFY